VDHVVVRHAPKSVEAEVAKAIVPERSIFYSDPGLFTFVFIFFISQK
jgi:hypothetical protein